MANKQKLTDFSLTTDSYAAFDALSLKDLIKDRLNDTSLFTGQNYEGSNISSVIDIISYSYHVLLFYLNQTATESMFSEAELYENMNRIVKSLDYKPVGAQTCTLSFTSKAEAQLPPNTYTIPRYAFINAGGVFYSFKEDVSFSKTSTGTQALTEFGNSHLLYEGRYNEYPHLTAIGEDYETVTLVPGNDNTIDHFNIDAYVKDSNSGKWSQWKRTSSLFLDSPTANAFEVRLNEHKRYELKFGNNVTGKRLNPGDTVAVFYLQSSGSAGEVGPGSIDKSRLARHNTVKFIDIFADVKDININYLGDSQLDNLTFGNANGSSEFYVGESTDDIRERAPKIFTSQYRLVTKGDYESYIQQNFSHVIKDVEVINNWDYLDGHLDYNINKLKLSSSNAEPRTLFNQVTFADSCDFNNIYIYAIPRLDQTSSAVARANYLTPAQKSAVITSVRKNKTLTTETVIMDPVYMGVSIGTYDPGSETISTSLKDNTMLRITREPTSTKSLDAIKNATYTIIVDYFRNFTINSTINVTQMVNDIMNIDGVQKIHTTRTDRSLETDGLSLLIWNPVYPDDDIATIGSNISLPYYKYPYLDDPTDFLNKIQVIAGTALIGAAEF